MKKLILFIVLSFALSFIALGQQKQGLSGQIFDQNNLPIAGATVHLLNTAHTGQTDAEGRFCFSDLQAGKYSIKISVIGYASTHTIFTIPTAAPLQVHLVPRVDQLDEVTVSAQKQDERLQDVPLSITVLSSEQVRVYGMTQIKDLKAVVPNLNAGNPGDGRNVVSIRGITSTSYDPAISTYIDGVNQFGLDTYIPHLLDVERIEVLRGPQGTLYGRNAMGGVINIITKQPNNQTKGYVQVDMASYNDQRYTLGLQTPIIKDKLLLGVSGMYNALDGYYKNTFDETNFDKQHSLMGNYFLKYIAHSNLSVVLNVKHNANRNNGAFPLAGSIADAFENPYQVNQNAIGRMSDNTFNTSLSIHHSGKHINLSSQTAYQYNYRYYKTPIDGDFSPLDGFSIINNYGKDWNKVQVITQEFRMTSPTTIDSRLHWTTGIYGFYQYNPVKQGTSGGEDALLMGSDVANFTNINTSTGKSAGLSVYGQATYALNDAFDATLGLRYDYEHKNIKGSAEFIMNDEPPVPFLPDQTHSAGYHAWSPKLNIAYKVKEDNRVYASYSRGFRAGGINQTTNQQLRFVNYKPEYSVNYELGSKNIFFNNRLHLNLAAFYTQVTDAQIPTLVLPEAITVTQNAGKLNSKGVEAELSAQLLKGLEIELNVGYTDAKYSDLKIADDGEVVNYDNNRQVFTPKETALMALQYTYELGRSKYINLVARGELQHLGEQYFDLKNLQNQEAYQTVNTRMGISTRRCELFLWGKNLTNKRFIDYAYDFGAAHLGNPRIYGISLGLKI